MRALDQISRIEAISKCSEISASFHEDGSVDFERLAKACELDDEATVGMGMQDIMDAIAVRMTTIAKRAGMDWPPK